MFDPINFRSTPDSASRTHAPDDPALRFLVFLQRAYGAEQHDMDEFPFDAEFRWCAANATGGWSADGLVFGDSDDFAIEAEGSFRFVDEGHRAVPVVVHLTAGGGDQHGTLDRLSRRGLRNRETADHEAPARRCRPPPVHGGGPIGAALGVAGVHLGARVHRRHRLVQDGTGTHRQRAGGPAGPRGVSTDVHRTVKLIPAHAGHHGVHQAHQ